MMWKGSDGSSPSTLILTSGATGRVNALFSLRALKSLFMLIHAIILFLLVPFRGRRLVSPVDKPGKDEKLQHERHRKGAVVRVPATIVPWKSSSSTSTTVKAVDQAVAARRAMAIRRVVEDDYKSTKREYSLFVTKRGDTIFTQSWIPVSVKIRGLVLLMHGLNEHSCRYGEFAKQLNAYGYKVYGMDWVGHGGTDGLHAYVLSLDCAVSDMKVLLEKIFTENPGLPCFCFGHSTGAAIVIKALLDPKIEARIAGAALTSPAVGVQPSHPIFAVIAPIVSFLLPTYQVNAANKKGSRVSRNPEALSVFRSSGIHRSYQSPYWL